MVSHCRKEDAGLLEPLHQHTQVGREFCGHLLVLPQAGMPAGTVEQVARLRGEVEAIDLVVAFLFGFGLNLVERLAGQLQLLSVEHRAAEEHYFGLGIMAAHGCEELAVGFGKAPDVVVVGGKVVGAQIDAHHVGLITREIPPLLEIVEERVFVLGGHGVFAARLGAVVVAIDANAASRHHPVLCVELTRGFGSVGEVVVLGFILEGVVAVDALVAVTAGDAVADELNLALGQPRGFGQLAARVEHESAEDGLQVVALDTVHQPHGVPSVRQRRCQRDHRVAWCVEAHLERFRTVYLGHEVAAHGLCHHFERRAAERGHDLRTGVGERGCVGIVETDAPRIDDSRVGGFHHLSLQRKRGGRHGGEAQQRGQECEDCFSHVDCTECFKDEYKKSKSASSRLEPAFGGQ